MIALPLPSPVHLTEPRAPAPAREKIRQGVPDAGWSREDLADRADWEIAKLRRRGSYAPIYWWLGKVLLLVRDDLDQRGEWTAWRKKHKIDRTKSQRALHFARAFDSPGDLEKLSIRKADRLARERLGLPEPASEEEERLRRRLTQLTRRTLPESLKDLAAIAQTRQLLPVIDQLGELFGQFYDLAQQKAHLTKKEE